MKKLFIPILAAMAIMAACQPKEVIETPAQEPETEVQEQEAPALITIRASIPSTKIALTPDGNGMHLAWQEGDQITVNGNVFNIKPGFTDHEAEFTGPAVEGSTFTISYGNTADSFVAQTQVGNDNTDHLSVSVALVNVDNYEDFCFSEEWAGEHGGDFHRSGVIKVVATMPNSASAIKRMNVKIYDWDMVLDLDGADLGNDHILTAYMSTPWVDIIMPAGEPVEFIFEGDDRSIYRLVKEPTSEITLIAGHASVFPLTQGIVEEPFYGGSGTDQDPYLIANKKHLHNVPDYLVDGVMKCFRMVDDVDMTGESWTPINSQDPYELLISFDGDGHTISGLSSPMFHDLCGAVDDLTLSNATISGTGITGALANVIKSAPANVTNVDLESLSVSASNYAGGLIGEIDADNTRVSGCDVTGTEVSGTLAGGVIGFANALSIIDGCSFDGGTVTASARYCGGFIGSTGNFETVISDCHVTDATITAANDRIGGFIGQLQVKATVKGCTVGTDAKRVIINSTKNEATLNLGGFVGVCYGKVLRGNNGERNKAYVKITSANTKTGTNVNIGGFAAYVEACTIEYSDVDADMSGLTGQQIGGFGGLLTAKSPGSKIDNCTSNATVTGHNYSGGFIGNSNKADHKVTNNRASGSVDADATVGGFVSYAAQGTWTGNSTSCSVKGRTNIGGFAGQINGAVTVSRCSSSGDTYASGGACGGFTGIAANGAKISDCYSTSNLTGSNRKYGGLIGYANEGTVTVERCYATGNISNNFEMGGLVGFVSVETFSMSKSAAWNETLVASQRAAENWSSAACVGVAIPTCTLTDNYRNPEMDLTAYWGTNAICSINLPTSFQHPNVTDSAPLTDPDGNEVTSSTMRPYQGKCDATKNLSQLASSTLGWDSSVWDFSSDLPTLK